MSLTKDLIKIDIINNDHILDKAINEWNSRYSKNLEKLSSKYGINMQLIYTSDSDSEKDYKINNNEEIVCKLIKQAIICKAYAETEHKAIKDIRTELEDCQMIKELGITLRKLEEERSEQNIKLKAINGKNLELLQEKQNLEKSLLELSLQYKLSSSIVNEQVDLCQHNDKKAALVAKLETYKNRSQIPKSISKNPDYCHIAPNMNLFSDSELSISEEDSLEKSRNRDTNKVFLPNVDGIVSPEKFGLEIKNVSKSTPIKQSPKPDCNNSRYSNAISNLTQDLQEIQKYFEKKEPNESILSPTHVFDWEMSQISFEDFKDQNVNGKIIECKEDLDNEHLLFSETRCYDERMIKLASNITSNIIHSSQNFIHQVDQDMEKLQSDLKAEQQKYILLSDHLADLCTIAQGSSTSELNEVPTCSGDGNRNMPQDPLEQLKIIKLAINNKCANDKKNMDENGQMSLNPIDSSVSNSSTQIQSKGKHFSDSRLKMKSGHTFKELPVKRNVKSLSGKESDDLPMGFHEIDDHKDKKNSNYFCVQEIKNHVDAEDIHENIFKILSETSVRLLTEMVTSLSKTNQLLSRNPTELHPNGTRDYTPLVTEYLQYLMSLDSVDFNEDNCKRHPIYDLLLELEVKVKNLVDNQNIESEGFGSISQTLETFYQEQLNKCYDDISRLKQQLESNQQLFISKLPLDASQVLFEAKQTMQTELESVDREYSRQMARERKRLEESEISYNELLADHEKMQKNYSENILSLNQQIEQFERKIEADRRFIEQQQFEWELERTQHNVDVENLNKSLSQMKKLTCNDNQSDCDEFSKERIHKSKHVSKTKCKSFSFESSEISSNNAATQTSSKDVIILNSHISFEDLDKYDEFIDMQEEVLKNQEMLKNIIHLLSGVIFELTDNDQFQSSLTVLRQFHEKDTSSLIRINDLEWNDIRSEIVKVHEFLSQFLENTLNLKVNFDILQEDHETNITNVVIKQDMIKALEDEVQNLVEFQRNLSKDYDLLQSMLEEKQNELDKISSKLLSQSAEDDQEDTIRTLEKELIEKQNVIDERDEDLYVLKEEKELVEQDLQLSKEKYESIITQHGDIYKDLEKEMKDVQKVNMELQEEVDQYSMKQCEHLKQLANLTRTNELLKNQFNELSQKNANFSQKNVILMDENKLAELRLTEIKDQHKLEILKMKGNLEDLEFTNRQLSVTAKKTTCNTTSCQTEITNNDKISKDSLMSFLSVQDKLIKAIDKLRKEYNREKELRYIVEAKYKNLTSQYETLSSNVFSLGNKVNETKTVTDQNGGNQDIMNRSLESIDINDLLNESQISVDEDIEFNKILQEYCQVESLDCLKPMMTTPTESLEKISTLQENTNDHFCFSDWLPDLLKEVEIVLQSCVIGGDLHHEMVSKINRFRNLLEQMYKKQLSILLKKISMIEHEAQLQRKNNQELKHKSDFIMAELQEKETIQKNLRIRLNQELSTNSRLTETNRMLSDQNRLVKNDFAAQISHLKDDLDKEKNRCMDINRQLKNDQHCREQLEAALSVADERMKLVEQSNAELIKKSRQQADYQQKEIDSFNTEYAEIFRRCNSYKIQIESLQQNLQYQMMESEKTKNELQETIQSNTEYRDKMNEYIKIYQERRKKLETEVNELHQLLQISCRREITFVKENETLRIKCQSVKNICKDYERKIKELENFVSDLHMKHEEDRHDWLTMINGNIDAKDKDDGILSQVNWLLKMLQLRIELLVLHYIPDAPVSADNEDDWRSESQGKPMFNCRPCSADSTLNRGNPELLMLLQSIKSMQSMINLYLNRNHNQITRSSSGPQSSETKTQFFSRLEKHSLSQNNASNRPKPAGSSESLESISDSDSVTEQRDPSLYHQEIDSLSTKIYVIQTNKIIELQQNLDHCEKSRQHLLDQKKYILSRLSHTLCSFIVTPLLTEEQQLLIKKNFFRFKFKAVAVFIIASNRFIRTIQSPILNISLNSRLKKAGSQLPQPKFSTHIPVNKSSQSQNVSPKTKIPGSNDHRNDILSRTNTNPSFLIDSKINNTKQMASNPKVQNELLNLNCESRSVTNHLRSNLNPVTSSSPIHSNKFVNVNNSVLSRPSHKSSSSGIPTISNSYSYSSRRSLPSSANRENVTNSLDRNISDKSANFSNTLKQIDDFQKRLEKYTDLPNGV